MQSLAAYAEERPNHPAALITGEHGASDWGLAEYHSGYQPTDADAATCDQVIQRLPRALQEQLGYYGWGGSLHWVLPYVEKCLWGNIVWMSGAEDSPSRCFEMQEENLDRLYTLRNAKEVHDFVGDEPEVLPILDQAPDVIRSYFDDSQLCLEVFHDPEEEGPPQLVVWIGTQLSAAEAIARRKSLMHAWGFGAMRRVNNKLSFSVEPV